MFKKKLMKKRCPLEYDEQRVFVGWLRIKKLDFFAVPNENAMSKLNKKTAAIQGKRGKATGTESGVQDLVVFTKEKILFIEMKRAVKSMSTVSDNQIKWNKIVAKYPYAEPFIAYGAKEAIAIVTKNI